MGRKLCGSAWVHSRASKQDIFTGSFGSISRTLCATTARAVNTSTPMADTTSIVASNYTPENVSNTAPDRTLTMNTATNPSLTSPTHASCSTSLITQSVLQITVHINL